MHLPLIRPADPDEPAAQACLAAYFALLSAIVPGRALPPLPLADADSFRPAAGGAFFLAKSPTSDPLGCIALRLHAPGTGEVKRLWVAEAARGRGLARLLLKRVEDHARASGLTRLVLDTNGTLTAALALYQATGWQPIAPYSEFPATHWFGKLL